MSDSTECKWYLNAGFTMFTLANDKVTYCVQPAVGNMGITNRRSEASLGEDYVEIRSEDAREILGLIEDAIKETFSGGLLDLDSAMDKASSLN